MAQLTYNLSQPEGQPGTIGASSGDDFDAATYNVVDDGVIKPGLCVAKIAADEDGAKLPASGSDLLIGVAMRDPTLEDNPLQSEIAFPEKWAVSVARKGSVYVQAEEAVTPDDDVYVRFGSDPEVFTIDFDVDFVVGNTINGSVGGSAIGAVPFNTDHATTIADLAAEIQDLTNVATATVTGARQITVTGQNAGETLSATTNLTVTGGAAQAVDTVANVTGPSSGTQAGAFRTDDDDTGTGATAVLLPRAKYASDGSIGVAALLDINLP